MTAEATQASRSWRWAWGYGEPPGPIIKPRPWKPHHLIGDFRERDLRRQAYGYLLIAVFLAAPVLLGVVSAFLQQVMPEHRDLFEFLVIISCVLAAILGLIGYLLVSITSEPPERVSVRILPEGD
jgi:hypothetical protein